MNALEVKKTEIEKFTSIANEWWDESGSYAPLHRITPTRISYIKEQVLHHYDRPSLEGLSILDIGCGGGLTCEPLTRLGARCIGVDAGAENIEAAKAHRDQMSLDIDYRAGLASDVVSEKFDVVLALEVIEHVEDPAAFVASCAQFLKPNGLIIFSTLNRTPKSFALGIVAAEYILRWVPRGTHEWRKFMKPSALAKMARNADLDPVDVRGLVFDPMAGAFNLSDTDLDVNYFLSARSIA